MDAIYARQSVEKKDSISIETQIEFCRRELTSGQEPLIYADKGYSGSTTERPEFQRLLGDVRNGKVGRIITYRLDRISRSVLDFANLCDMFSRCGVSFNSTQERFDTSTPMGKAMLNIAMVFAQLERETIQGRIKDNYYSRGEKGMYLGGPAPFGFTKTEMKTESGRLKMLAEEPKAAATLTRVYEMYAGDLLSLGAIARQLNEEGVASPNGGRWDSCKISRVLRNPVSVMADAAVYRYYRERGCKFTNELSDFALGKGCYLYGKREGHERKYTDVTGHTLSLAPHDGIIPSEIFLACQRRLDGNKQIDNRRKSELTWLTGLIKCEKCGYSVVPKSSNNGKYTYLYCTGKTNVGCCDVKTNLGRLSAVEAAVERRIFAWAERYSELKAVTERKNNKEREKQLCRIEEIDGAIRRLLDLAVQANEVSSKYLNEKLSELESERQSLKDALDAVNGSVEYINNYLK
ncbi:MAG: recombinase family protein [Oscillospiraceae bacterium]|jgi:DNA invertase Pin-like site-specific DNA recombinase|nr:recombinase family protein [Oscillospiraceae bacterium]